MEIRLGENKVVNITPWKSKTKKEFIKVFKLKEDKVNEDDILEILVYPYIEEKTSYYSSDEIQYILINLRKISIDKKIEFGMECTNEECKKDFDIFTDLDSMTNFRPGSFPQTIDDITWRDLNNKDALKKVIAKYPEEPPRELDLLMHIENYKGTAVSSIPQIMEIIDELSLQESTKLNEDYDNIKAELKIELKCTCSHCDLTKLYSFDIIPTFFDPLLPKDL